jgi:hypothetical protein
MPVWLLNTDDVIRLLKLAKEEQLNFSPNFLRRFKESLSESHLRGPGQRDQLRLAIIQSLRDKLASKLNKPSIKIPWEQIEAGDIINWPSTVKFMSVWLLKGNDLKTIHKLVKEDQLDFSPEFLSKYKMISKS